jgi:hypothetical protein
MPVGADKPRVMLFGALVKKAIPGFYTGMVSWRRAFPDRP